MKDRFERNRDEMTPAERHAVWERVQDEVRGPAEIPAPRRRLAGGWMRWVGSAAVAGAAAGLLVAVFVRGERQGEIALRESGPPKLGRYAPPVDLSGGPGAARDQGGAEIAQEGAGAPDPDDRTRGDGRDSRLNSMGYVSATPPRAAETSGPPQSEVDRANTALADAVHPRAEGGAQQKGMVDLDEMKSDEPQLAALTKDKNEESPVAGAASQSMSANETPPAAPSEPGTSAGVTSPVTAPREPAGADAEKAGEDRTKLASRSADAGAKSGESPTWGKISGLYDEESTSPSAEPERAREATEAAGAPAAKETSTAQPAPMYSFKHRAINPVADSLSAGPTSAPADAKRDSQAVALIDTTFFTVTQIADSLNPGLVDGTVVDASTNEPIPFANILLVGTVRGKLTDESGSFRLGGLDPGIHALQVTSHLYSKASVPLQLAEGHRLLVLIRLRLDPGGPPPPNHVLPGVGVRPDTSRTVPPQR